MAHTGNPAYGKIYNMHTHIFPGKIADKAVHAIGDFYSIPMQCGGTSEELLRGGQVIGVKKYLVCSTATKAEQVAAINSFVAGEAANYSEFIGFGSLHPDMEHIEEEVDRLMSLGLKGIKLHPDFQHFCIDDPHVFPLYDAIQGRLPLLIHMGDDRYDYSKPHRMLAVLEQFPKLTVLASHLGGYRCWEEALSCHTKASRYLAHPRVYLDTSSALMFLTPEKAVEIIRTHGAEKVFFGTDSPMWNQEEELERFLQLPLTAEEQEAILYRNAETFWNE